MIRSLRKTIAIARRELVGYLVSPISWVVAAAFLFVSGYFFTMVLFAYRSASMQGWFHNTAILFVLIIPVLTMRLIAEERRQRTWPLLMTSPLSPGQIVVGKFVACYGLVLTIIALTISYPLVFTVLEATPDWGPIQTGFLGLALFAGALVSIGLFASSLTSEQLVAAMVAFALSMFFCYVGWLEIYTSNLKPIIKALSLLEPLDDFVKGILTLHNVIYYLSVIFVFLFAASRMIHGERWR